MNKNAANFATSGPGCFFIGIGWLCQLRRVSSINIKDNIYIQYMHSDYQQENTEYHFEYLGML